MFACFIDDRLKMAQEGKKDYFDKKAEEYATQGIRGVGKFFGDFFNKAKTNIKNMKIGNNNNPPSSNPSSSQKTESSMFSFFFGDKNTSSPSLKKDDEGKIAKQISVPSINLIDLSGDDKESPKTERSSTTQEPFLQPYKSNPMEGSNYSFLHTQNPNQPYMSTPGIEENLTLDLPVRKVKEIKLSAPNKKSPVSLDLLLLQQQEEHFLQKGKQQIPSNHSHSTSQTLSTIEESPNEVSYEEFLKKLESSQNNLHNLPVDSPQFQHSPQLDNPQLYSSDPNLQSPSDDTSEVSYEEFMKKLELQKKLKEERDNGEDLYDN
jgi:hypothetical protein